ncbi:MAG TPA: DUF1772 domain-containing protein, partial [Labilithrix sp.]|nr:DUF1772 domain-containing protein [Labilithrix sp.]
MALLLARFLGLLLVGSAAGATLCVVFIERGLGDSGSFYVAYKQMMIRTLTVPLPLLAALSGVLVAVDCVAQWRAGAGASLWLAVGALLLIIAGGVMTKVGHFPLNATIASWDAAAPPPIWSSMQAKWSALHLARTAVTVLAFALFILSNL